MFSKRVKRAASVFAASALLVAGGTAAQAISTEDIYPNESTDYLGWHQGDPAGENSYEVRWDGLHFGFNGPAQIINGLVDKGGQPEVEERMSAAEVVDFAANTELYEVAGSVYFQLALFYLPEGEADDVSNLKWTTVRPRDAAPESDVWESLDVAADWTGTYDLDGQSKPLADLLGDLDAQFFELVGYGVYASAPSSIQMIDVPGTITDFGWDAYWTSAELEDLVDTALADLDAEIDGVVQEVCEAIVLGSDTEGGSLSFAINSEQVPGETTEQRWEALASALISFDYWEPYHLDLGEDDGLWNLEDGASFPITSVTLSHGVSQENAEQVTITGGLTPWTTVAVDGDVPGIDGQALLGDVIQALVENPDTNVWLDGFAIGNGEGGYSYVSGVSFYEEILVKFPGICDEDVPDTEKPETKPSDDGKKDDDKKDDDAAKPVVADPKYAG